MRWYAKVNNFGSWWSSNCDLNSYFNTYHFALQLNNINCDCCIFSCCPDKYSLVYCDLQMTRRPLFYAFNLLLPCMLLLVIGSLSFCMPAESGERVSLSVTVLLAMMVFIMVLMENMPPTSKVIPLMGRDTIFCTFALYVCIVIFHPKEVNCHDVSL